MRHDGFLQFSILHPCFVTRYRRVYHAPDGPNVELASYFEDEDFVEEWTFIAAPETEAARWPKFRVAYYRRTLEYWFTALDTAGFTVEGLAEPRPSEAHDERHPNLADTHPFPQVLQFRCRLRPRRVENEANR